MSPPRNEVGHMSRRQFVTTSVLTGSGLFLAPGTMTAAGPEETPAPKQKAQIAISLDLEMARNFPHWQDKEWDYEKGNLTDAVKKYAVEAARRVKDNGGVIHFFLVCRALEQENIVWLEEIVKTGHSVGNHTYDHVYIRADNMDDVQFRFKRAPWLVQGKTPAEVIRENIRLATAAMKSRLGIEPNGFRAAGGFADGLIARPDVQQMLMNLDFKWVSTMYPAHPNSKPPGGDPTPEILEGIARARRASQPFVYPGGLIEIPMSPSSDIVAFRNGRWSLESFLDSVRLGVEWAIENGTVFDYLSHPAVLSVMDPEFRTVKLICDLVQKAGNRAEIVNLDAIARRISQSGKIKTKAG
jgi:peptidoglycan/xylan/chitin deacetylase (PgdA/CDA1 family)